MSTPRRLTTMDRTRIVHILERAIKANEDAVNALLLLSGGYAESDRMLSDTIKRRAQAVSEARTAMSVTRIVEVDKLETETSRPRITDVPFADEVTPTATPLPEIVVATQPTLEDEERVVVEERYAKEAKRHKAGVYTTGKCRACGNRRVLSLDGTCSSCVPV